MERFAVFLAFLLLLNPVSAQVMKDIDYDIDLRDDGTSVVKLHLLFTEDLKEVNVPLDFEIYDIKVEGGTCDIKVANLLFCRPPSEHMVGLVAMNITFNTEQITEVNQNISSFYLDIPILWETENVDIYLMLPFRTALPDDNVRPISPPGGVIGSDGRRVTVTWNVKDKAVGDVIPLRVRYEFITPIENIVNMIAGYWIVAISIAVLILGFFIYRKVGGTGEAVYSVLTEPERMVIELISKEPNGEMDQRKLVKVSGFSKAKVSRTVNSLVSRGIVHSIRLGRKNKVVLKKGLLGMKYRGAKNLSQV
ncbi:hypothetical protein A3K63_01820 [Candidatus Micrarchaeota archaeon RBG_16_49_10]|nr:MAG: hypothetical protein A3K63_01820 [Candidatus Micrarchaeota archaeon RBG_16_49_10]